MYAQSTGFIRSPGLDLNKSADILHAAYDDACGITAKFNKNILHRINSELGADFDLEQFEHHVVYDEKQMRVGMYLKSMQRQTVSIPKSGIRTVFEKDEMIHTENSFKYTPDSIKLMLSQAGLKSKDMWCDEKDVCTQACIIERLDILRTSEISKKGMQFTQIVMRPKDEGKVTPWEYTNKHDWEMRTCHPTS